MVAPSQAERGILYDGLLTAKKTKGFDASGKNRNPI
jgi:hypothetical protein